ncbi:hypothetical protein [Frigoriglobus tundricola]|uniref:Uncharacterized protein n=1 Tax=Frigoriglobus tundricola TaxID=2774151 RepID=A0A6M5YXN7_9BACT|nr:hypothetical protein [Frigoriglobus tundricola]QJW98668.1 hypothetical protein FTUN_6263 [Frigoriglobus tundricola]
MDANEARKQLRRELDELARAAQSDLDLGVDPEVVSSHLARVSDKLPGEAKGVLLGAMLDGLSDEALDAAGNHMTDEELAKMEQFIAVAKSRRSARSGPNPPPG